MRKKGRYNPEIGEPLWHDENEKTIYVPTKVIDRINYAFNGIINDGYTSRTKKKEEYTHDVLKNELCGRLPDGYATKSKTENETYNSEYGEYKAKYHNYDSGKNVDIAIIDENTNNPVCFIECKFPISSTAKNRRNLKEAISDGIHALHKANENIPLFLFNILPSETPNFKPDKTCSIENNRVEIKNYENLAEDLISDGIVKGVFLFMFDDDKMGYCQGLTREQLIEEHKKGFTIKPTISNFKCEYLIYNDFDRFVDLILNAVNEYDRNKYKNKK